MRRDREGENACVCTFSNDKAAWQMACVLMCASPEREEEGNLRLDLKRREGNEKG